MTRRIALMALAVISIALALPGSISAGTIHVPGDQPTIQSGIDAAVDGDTVLVADGTYTGPGNKDLDIGGKAITVRSVNGAESCIIDCQGDGRGFSIQSNEGPESVVEGFTITGGFLDGYSWAGMGAGILIVQASPTIRNNIITGNSTDRLSGGGICCGTICAPLITGNTISNNSAFRWGGGICCIDGCSAVITGNTITENSAVEEGGGIYGEYGNYGDSYGTITVNIISGNEANDGGGVHVVGPVTIRGNTIEGNSVSGDYAQGGGIYCMPFEEEQLVVADNLIGHNSATGWFGAGGGLYCRDGSILISSNTFSGNSVEGGYSRGGGICCATYSEPVVVRNTIIGNSSAFRGGGIACTWGMAILAGNLIMDNTAVDKGGGIYLPAETADQVVSGCTLVGNQADRGGGICLFGSGVVVENSIFWGNQADFGPSVFLAYDYYYGYTYASLAISYSDMEGGEAGVGGDVSGVDWGPGMIDADPLFVSGPEGDHYLSQIAAGQPGDSPCLDTGNPESGWPGTTRTDGELDRGTVDMGYHYPVFFPSRLLAAPGPNPLNPALVRVFPPGQDTVPELEFAPFDIPYHGANVSCGDVDGDGVDEILAGPGPSVHYGPVVRGFRMDGTAVPGLATLAYGVTKYGLNVAAGDLDGNGVDEIVTGPGPGPVFGPHVRAFAYDTAEQTVSPVPGVSFFAYGTLRWGVNISAGDIDGDGFDEIVTGAGPGAVFGPHVRGWDVDGCTAQPMAAVSYFSYGTLRYGVNVASGDVDGDGIDEIITAPGPSNMFGAHIRGWNFDGSSVVQLPGFSFFAWPPDQVLYGAEVFAGTDLDGDGRDELVVGIGPDPDAGTAVRVFRYEGSEVTAWFSLQAFSPELTHGVNIAAGRN